MATACSPHPHLPAPPPQLTHPLVPGPGRHPQGTVGYPSPCSDRWVPAGRAPSYCTNWSPAPQRCSPVPPRAPTHPGHRTLLCTPVLRVLAFGGVARAWKPHPSPWPTGLIRKFMSLGSLPSCPVNPLQGRGLGTGLPPHLVPPRRHWRSVAECLGKGTKQTVGGERDGEESDCQQRERACGFGARGSKGGSDSSWRSEQGSEVFGGTLGAEGLHICVKGAFRSWGSPVCVGSALAGCRMRGGHSASTEGPVEARASAGFCGTGPVPAVGLGEETSDCRVPHLCVESHMHVRSMCVDVGVCLRDGHVWYLECIRVPYGCGSVSVC